MDNGFQGQEGQEVPEMTAAYCNSVSDRYIELFEKITGEEFVKADARDLEARIERNVLAFFEK